MICILCSRLIESQDLTKMTTQGTTHKLHKKCLRTATQKVLIEKGLIKPNNPSWWINI